MLVGIWSEVLEREEIGVEDNFFEMGGHSLLATRVNSWIREAFEVEMSVGALFESPTIRELGERIEGEIRERRGLGGAGIEKVERGGGGEVMSYAQQRLWFMDQMERGSGLYNVPCAVRLKGEMKEEAMRRALGEIVRRHEVLRTVFKEERGEAVQVVEEAKEIEMEVVDLRGRREEEKEEEIRRESEEEGRKGFDLRKGPMLRVKALKVSEEEQVVLLTMHHIVSDGWSMGILVKELGELYGGYSKGEEPELKELPIQYVDFAVWQRKWLRGEVYERQMGYWKEQLGEKAAVLELPTDRPRPSVQYYRGATEEVELSEELSERVKRVSRQEGMTVFMTLLAGFDVLLSRYSGQEEVIVGTPIANRNRAETEGLIGFFVNTLVLKTDMRGEPSYREVMRRVREVCLGAYANQDMPFEKLVDELGPKRDLSYSPLFQVMFVMQNVPRSALKLEGLSVRQMSATMSTSKFDLTMGLVEEGGVIGGAVEYNTDLFDATTIQRMMRHYENVLESAMRNPDRKVWELEMLSEVEREEVLVEWNQTERGYEKESTIQEQFYEQARRRGRETAIEVEGERVSYEELNRRTNKLARYLRKKGVREEARVGICEERGRGMVEGMLGIVKAGGAYVPMEPSYPVERLKQMMEDGEIGVVLSRSGVGVEMGEVEVEWVKVDEEWGEIEKESGEDVEIEGSGESLAYVMYTSGSTGKPKGVAVTHRGVVRLVKSTEYVKLDEEEVILQYAPMSFDAATFEIWGGLLNGGRVAIARAGRQTVEELGKEIESKGVSTMWLTSALFQQMVELNIEGLKGVRQLVAGGDVCR